MATKVGRLKRIFFIFFYFFLFMLYRSCIFSGMPPQISSPSKVKKKYPTEAYYMMSDVSLEVHGMVQFGFCG